MDDGRWISLFGVAVLVVFAGAILMLAEQDPPGRGWSEEQIQACRDLQLRYPQDELVAIVCGEITAKDEESDPWRKPKETL